MLKLALIGLFALSLGTLAIAASYLPVSPGDEAIRYPAIADAGL